MYMIVKYLHVIHSYVKMLIRNSFKQWYSEQTVDVFEHLKDLRKHPADAYEHLEEGLASCDAVSQRSNKK